MTSPVACTRRAPWGVAGLCQRWALAMGTISTLAEAHLFSRGESVVDDVEGVLTCDRHLVDQPHGRQYAPKSVRAGFKVGVEMAGAAAGAPCQVRIHPTSRRLMVWMWMINHLPQWRQLQMLVRRENPLLALHGYNLHNFRPARASTSHDLEVRRS